MLAGAFVKEVLETIARLGKGDPPNNMTSLPAALPPLT
jgi:hypothetical protein